MNRALLEIGRQAFHVICGVLVILLILTVQRELALIILFLAFLLITLIAIVSTKIRIPVVGWFIEELERDKDRKLPAKGAIFFLSGCLLTFKLFSQDIALAAIVVLTFGDAVSTLAGFFGQKYGHKPFSRFKTLYGTIIGAVVSFLVALIFIEPLYAAVAAIFGMFVEALVIKLGETEADDNLIVPLAAGTACYLLRLILR